MSRRRSAGSLILIWLMAAIALACAGPASAPLDDVGETAGRPLAGDPDDQPGEPPTGGGDQQVTDQALIVHTGSMALEVAELRPAVEQANALIAGLGGQIASSHELSTAREQSASVTYRIPAERWTEALTGLRSLGHRVLSETTEAQDVTAQVVDLDARIANLRTSEAALQSIMGQATTIDDVLRVQRELTTVRGDIESMTAQRDHLANQAALGTLQVTFEVPVGATDVANQGWDLGREVDNAIAALVRETQGLATIAIWLAIAVLPVVLPVVLLIYLGVRIRRRYLAGQAARDPIPPSM